MASEIVREEQGLTKGKFDMGAIIQTILPRGHVIHGYSNGANRRLLMVLESRSYSDHAPLLGFGIDGTAERALGRALVTYALREQQGLQYITETQMPESTTAQVPGGGHPSRFDNIVWGSDFWLYQEGQEFVAGSNYGGGPGGRSKLEVSASAPLDAIITLTDTYDGFVGSVRTLPSIAL